jgi:hypothetical protein
LANAFGAQYNRTIGGPQSTRIYTIDTNQRVLIRGGQGDSEKHKGDYYHSPTSSKGGGALMPATLLESVVNRQMRNLTGGSGDASDHVAPSISRSPIIQTKDTTDPDLAMNQTASSIFLSALR